MQTALQTIVYHNLAPVSIGLSLLYGVLGVGHLLLSKGTVSAPIIYLFTRISPIASWSADFLWHLIPFLILNKLMFRYVAWGMSVWRGEQYNLALFPLWIQAVVSVFTGRKLGFVVTPKQRQSGNYLRLIWPQLLLIGLTALAILYALVSLLAGSELVLQGAIINAVWGVYNIVMLAAIVKAAIYKPPSDWEARPPDFLFSHGAPAAGE